MAYDDVKQAGGRRYTGMAIGRSHHWDYPDGTWVETKVSPTQWAVRFTSHKRRKGRGAPRGSGAKVGAEYHWFIVAHQRARKLDANTYLTDMVGAKHMVAFRQPGWYHWSSQMKGHRTQKDRLVAILEAALAAVKASDDVPDGDALVHVPGMAAGDVPWPPEVAALPGTPDRHAPAKSPARPTRRRPARPVARPRRRRPTPATPTPQA